MATYRQEEGQIIELECHAGCDVKSLTNGLHLHQLYFYVKSEISFFFYLFKDASQWLFLCIIFCNAPLMQRRHYQLAVTHFADLRRMTG